jgi:hypothetical protein
MLSDKSQRSLDADRRPEGKRLIWNDWPPVCLHDCRLSVAHSAERHRALLSPKSAAPPPQTSFSSPTTARKEAIPPQTLSFADEFAD